jgi:hypothetical protein
MKKYWYPPLVKAVAVIVAEVALLIVMSISAYGPVYPLSWLLGKPRNMGSITSDAPATVAQQAIDKTAKTTITARFPGRKYMIFSFLSTKLGEQLLAVKGFICLSVRFGFYKKKRVAVLNLRQPGYLQETRGFPSPPRDAFGFF